MRLIKKDFAVIGHHSHSHDYLIDESNEVFIKDMKTADLIFKKKTWIYT